MDIKDQLDKLQAQFGMSYKEARYQLKAYLRKLYEAGDISKAEWKAARNYMKEELK